MQHRIEKVEHVLQEVKDIHLAFENVANIQESATLAQFGITLVVNPIHQIVSQMTQVNLLIHTLNTPSLGRKYSISSKQLSGTGFKSYAQLKKGKYPWR